MFNCDGMLEIGFTVPAGFQKLECVVEEQKYPLHLSLRTSRQMKLKAPAERQIEARRRVIAPSVEFPVRKSDISCVERSSIHGFGLFAVKDVPKETVIIEYQGRVIEQLLGELVERTHKVHGFESTYLFKQGNRQQIVDATFVGNGGRFANHSCGPNARSQLIGNKVVLKAIRDIKAGEEIVYNYNMRRENGLQRVNCYCGAATCKGFMDQIE